MPVIQTANLSPLDELDKCTNDQVYCGLDSSITLEVLHKMERLIKPENQLVYNFELGLQAPLIEMMLRGIKIDQYERDKAISAINVRTGFLQNRLNSLALEIWDKPLNPRSDDQLKSFFYGAMKLPEQFVSDKGVRRLSTNRDSLEALDNYYYARPILSLVTKIKDLSTQRSTLRKEIDSDGRFRTSFNITTETGRLSSSKSAFGTGSNIQNLERDSEGEISIIRKVFVADPEKIIVGIDLEQTESRDVGFLQGLILNDWTYLDLVENSDIHVEVCKLIWPELPWTGDKKLDKKLAADTKFYRNYSFREMAKKGGHSANYMTTPFGMRKNLKIPLSIAREFQDKYYSAFPAFPLWYQYIAQQLQTTQTLTTPFGRVRTFFGRPDDDSTLREAIAFVPQSSTADRMNLGILQLWHGMKSRIQLLAQIHDAVYFQCDPKEINSIIPEALELIKVPLYDKKSGRTLIVPGEAKIGFNLSNWNENLNPFGMKKYDVNIPDTREVPSLVNWQL